MSYESYFFLDDQLELVFRFNKNNREFQSSTNDRKMVD